METPTAARDSRRRRRASRGGVGERVAAAAARESRRRRRASRGGVGERWLC
ncbi:hypothetical protein ACP4OV_020942 [Aristida adscensionis]